MKKKKFLVVILVLCVCFSLCGAGWFNNTKVVIDTENNAVYQYCTADTIISAFVKDSKVARKDYQDAVVLLSGKVKSIGKDGKNMVLVGANNTALTIDCSYAKELREVALAYKVGESVALYGKIKLNIFDNNIHLKAVKIVEVPTAISSNEVYYLLDGSSFDKTKSKKITLNNGGVEFYVPSSWVNQDVQCDILAGEIGTMEGYQYVLNKLGSGDSVPESFFVAYFDNQKQLSDYLNDSDETELIEKEIVENILGSVGSFPSKEVDTYYGSEYVYYIGSYKTIFDTGTGYHTEFIFQADGEDGIVVMLYVYKEARHLSDVLFVSRFLEIYETTR